MKRRLVLIVGVLILIVGFVVGFAVVRTGHEVAPVRTGHHAAPVCGNGKVAPTRYQHVVVFAFENRKWSGVGGVGFGSMPYFKSLAASCGFFTDWTEVHRHRGSITQYVGQLTGTDPPGFEPACMPSATCNTTANNLFRQLRFVHQSAVNYVDGATTSCSAAGNIATHVPTMYLWGSDDRKACRTNTRPYSEFSVAHLPAFAFITPTRCHDGHDCPNAQVDAWARVQVKRVLSSAAYQSGTVAVFIWYDETSPVPNLVIAPTVKHGPFSTPGIGAPSTLKAWQSMLGLGCLANSCRAPNLRTPANL